MKNNNSNNYNSTVSSVRAFSVLLTVFCFASTAVNAAQWEYGAIVDLGGIYSDNIFLNQSGLEESETVYTIASEFYLRTNGDRIVADIRYRPEAYFYKTNSTADNVFHVVDASMTNTLIRDKLFLLLSASNFQSIITPEGRIPTSNIPISNNRVDSRVFEVRPYWQQRLGSADLLLEVGYTDIEYDDVLFQGSNITRGKFNLDNFARQQGIAWGLGYNHIRADYDFGQEWEHQRAQLDLGYWINGAVRVFAAGGAETDVTRIADPNLDESFWEAGVQYKPNQRLNLEVATGERYYGTSIRANVAYTMRRGTTTLTYAEGPSTGAQLPTGRRPIAGTDNLDGVLDQAGRSDQFLQRRLNWVTNIELAKSELTVRVFREIREQRTTIIDMPLDDQEYGGIALRWSWRAGTRTTVGIGADSSRIDDSQRKSDLRRLQFDVAYQIGQRMNLRAEYVHSDQDGRESGQFDNIENQYRLFLRAEF